MCCNVYNKILGVIYMPTCRVLPMEYMPYTHTELLCNHFKAQGTTLYVDMWRGPQ